jgi:hypothetical protein
MHRAILFNRVSCGVSSSVCEAVYAEQSSIVTASFELHNWDSNSLGLPYQASLQSIMHAMKYHVVPADTDGQAEAFTLRGQRLTKRSCHPHFFDDVPLRAVYSILYTQTIPHTAVDY